MKLRDLLFILKCKLLGRPLPKLIVTYSVGDGPIQTKTFKYGQRIKLP